MRRSLRILRAGLIALAAVVVLVAGFVAWLLQRPLVASVIIGGRNIGQFEDNLKAVDLKLTPEDIADLDKVSQPNLIYPYWHQSFSVTARMSEADLSLHRPYITE